jgi:4-hydroxy-3-methylbut-2-enyl diphosphate reductase IspH
MPTAITTYKTCPRCKREHKNVVFFERNGDTAIIEGKNGHEYMVGLPVRTRCGRCSKVDLTEADADLG